MNAEDRTRIYIPAPKRGRLPRTYEFERRGPLTWQQKLRRLSVALLLCAMFWGAVYLIASHR